MRKLAILLAVFGLLVLVAEAYAGDVYVKPYIRSDGTYVNGHYRTSPDSTPYNNYGTTPNVNPYTGERGYTNPYNQPKSYENNYMNPSQRSRKQW